MNLKVQIDFAFWNTMETERLQKSAQMSKKMYGKYKRTYIYYYESSMIAQWKAPWKDTEGF